MPDTRLHHIRRQISRQVAFPEELSISFDEQAALDFLSDVAACDDRDEPESFTRCCREATSMICLALC